MDSRSFRLGVDIGGTFTDFVLVDEQSGQTYLEKRLTTPHNPAEAVLAGLSPLLEAAGTQPGNMAIAIHATTLVTNALIERKGAPTALFATAGFRDVIEMGTEVRYDIYDLRMKNPEPLVARDLRFDIEERIWRDGTVLVPLSESSVASAIEDAHSKGARSFAVCFLHSFRDGSHESKVRSQILDTIPGAYVSISSEVAPEIREYERVSTTVANAYVQPILQGYIDQIDVGLKAAGYPRELYLMLSSGGITSRDSAKRFPVRLAESGPAAGVLAAVHISKNIGIDSFVSFDMGGTTAKIALVFDGQPAMASQMEVARVHRFKRGSGISVKVPVVELIEIGAGGGSIASVDRLGLLAVGPHSTGSDPGPACYGQGGTLPTVTDANLLLGYLNENNFMGGEMLLNRDAAESAIAERLAKPLNLSLEAASQGVFEVVNQNMLSAMKVHIAERGGDPGEFYLVAFGGAGPVHSYELARQLGMKGVIVPAGAGAASALGLVVTAPSFEQSRSYVARLDETSWAGVHQVLTELEAEGRKVLAEAGIEADSESIMVERSVDCRYAGQGHELNVAISPVHIADSTPNSFIESFHKTYEEKYGHSLHHLQIEVITTRVVVRGPAPSVPQNQIATHSDPNYLKGSRPVWFSESGEYLDTPVFDRYKLGEGFEQEGPALIEERECTVAIGPSGTFRIVASGHVVIEIAKPQA